MRSRAVPEDPDEDWMNEPEVQRRDPLEEVAKTYGKFREELTEMAGHYREVAAKARAEADKLDEAARATRADADRYDAAAERIDGLVESGNSHFADRTATPEPENRPVRKTAHHNRRR